MPPGGKLVATEAHSDPVPEPPRVAAVGTPGRQPRAQLVVAGQHRPFPQPLGHLARRVDDERLLTATLDAMDPALADGAVADAGRTEPRSDGQRGHRVPGFVPGRPHRRGPGRRVAGRGAEVVTLPDPRLVHDGLVVVADKPGQFGLDLDEGPGLCGGHHGLPRGDSTQNSLPSGSASTVQETSPCPTSAGTAPMTMCTRRVGTPIAFHAWPPADNRGRHGGGGTRKPGERWPKFGWRRQLCVYTVGTHGRIAA